MLSLEERREIVEKSLKESGFIVKDGLKYGLDFLVYTDLPEKVHSKYGVAVDNGMTYQDMVTRQRVCCASKKELVVAFIDEDRGIKYLLCDRFVTNGTFGSRRKLDLSVLSLGDAKERD
ncbi:hypothetical protein PAEPH01_0548 [Pancytospora epiphaga]|nr:hypothetical protein PAEPH01_0548 [Pancytospora epiphaga]